MYHPMGKFSTLKEAKEFQKIYSEKMPKKFFPIHKTKSGEYAIRSMSKNEFMRYQESLLFKGGDFRNEIYPFQTNVF